MPLQFHSGPALLRWWLGLLLAGLAGLSWAAAPGAASESAVKAAFLYRIAGLVEWPSGSFQRPEDPFVIAVAGQDAIAADLEQIVAGRAVDSRPVLVRRLREGEGVPEGVHLLMLGAGRESRARELAAAPGPVLVVMEQENGHRLGAAINFMVEGGRLRFTASLPAAESRGLRLSARLLAVALAVEGRGR
jgi:hypothetical protein